MFNKAKEVEEKTEEAPPVPDRAISHYSAATDFYVTLQNGATEIGRAGQLYSMRDHSNLIRFLLLKGAPIVPVYKADRCPHCGKDHACNA